MRILHVITSLHTGGAETLVVNLLPRFHALGHEMGIVVFNGENGDLMTRLKGECPECKIYLLGKSYYNPLYIFKLIRIMKGYDIVHTHNSSPQLYSAIANMFCRKKLVTTEHSSNNRKREQGGLLRIIDKLMYKRYDSIICISSQAEKNIRKYINVCSGSIVDKRIRTIFNGVDVDKFHLATPLSITKEDRFIVIMVAGFREAKDQDTLINAFSLLPKNEYELWLVGDGQRREILETLVSKKGLENNVKFLGLRMDVPQILKTADVVVMSSHWEGMSLSNIEGMSAGKPFVASDVDGLREVTKGYGILFPHEDAEALAKIIQRLAEDKDYYNEIAERCYFRAKEFDISKTVEGYDQIYQSLVNGN